MLLFGIWRGIWIGVIGWGRRLVGSMRLGLILVR